MVQPLQVGLELGQEEAISSQSLVRILVVDDFADWRHYIIEKLRGIPGMKVIGVASDGLESIRKAEELQPDVILMDIGLPKLDGIRAIRQIRRCSPESKILLVTHEDDPDVAEAAFNAGGHGYLVKLDAPKELFGAIEAVILGKRFVSAVLRSKIQ